MNDKEENQYQYRLYAKIILLRIYNVYEIKSTDLKNCTKIVLFIVKCKQIPMQQNTVINTPIILILIRKQ